jgi:hypothetical protein
VTHVVGFDAFLFEGHWTSTTVSTELVRAYKKLITSKHWTFDTQASPILGSLHRRTIVNGLLFPVSIKTECEYNVHGSGLKLPQKRCASHFTVNTGRKKQVSPPRNLQKDKEGTSVSRCTLVLVWGSVEH